MDFGIGILEPQNLNSWSCNKKCLIKLAAYANKCLN